LNAAAKVQTLKLLAKMVSALRDYFDRAEFVELFPPAAVAHPGIEPHLHPFQLYSAFEKKVRPLYLNTSPEFAMKQALAMGMDKIFTLGHSFRDEPNSDHHRPQFLMLEWYRAPGKYEEIAQDLEQLLLTCSQALGNKSLYAHNPITIEKFTVDEIFYRYTGGRLVELMETKALQTFMKKNHGHLLPDTETLLEWEDYFFLLFLNLVEPELNKHEAVMLFDYPLPIAALSQRHPDKPYLCKRFELYLRGIEIANCYQELTDLHEQRARWQIQEAQKKRLYHYSLGEPEQLFSALKQGLPNPSAGIALGVERLLMGLTGIENPFWE
jgi:lysyl-tRNA synthetase class 2